MKNNSCDVLLLGQERSGKTYWLQCCKHDQFKCNGSTMETVGVNLETISFSLQDTNKTIDITIREVGSALAPTWKRYLQDCTLIIVL